jgi:predicted nicotinamide N-methyase
LHASRPPDNTYDRNVVRIDELPSRWVTGSDGLQLLPVPLVPEIRLHVAADAQVLWARMEAEAGTTLPYPFWASAWLGGQALARFVLDHPRVVAGRRVLDLASGSGVVAIAASLAGAASVTAVDIDQHAVVAIGANARVNAVEIAVRCASMSDHDTESDIVLVGDAFYSASMAETLLPVLERIRTLGARVLIGDPGRSDLPRDRVQVLATYSAASAAAAVDAQVRWVHVLRWR